MISPYLDSAVEEARNKAAKAVAACWIISQDSAGLVRDTFEELINEFKQENDHWQMVGGPALVEALKSENEIWRALSLHLGAVENPLGVISFGAKRAEAEWERKTWKVSFRILSVLLRKLSLRLPRGSV